MTNRKIVYIEFYSPWLFGGYSTTTVDQKNDLFEAVAIIISEDEQVVKVALGESQGNFLHQVRLPRSCIKTIIELPKPFICENAKETDLN